ncbi:hypothetical protein AMAG_04069 [Allomyces macrogynus ATCC 38327]|uniref:PUM-HD domain-containing protein n=1 Tax=Allomyces macrogynus (strain ATCC 38327) TaxID=578462 RepID=A0A0L0S835_ALLM3|nr:hypothetical protein AMAG_04069 [Allomyces macrogynus ATCC 38327]|eukprot:KNE58499.1 hypothetical protein AMAG_04069 [Allomyces macrogynus ATCC 38327]
MLRAGSVTNLLAPDQQVSGVGAYPPTSVPWIDANTQYPAKSPSAEYPQPPPPGLSLERRGSPGQQQQHGQQQQQHFHVPSPHASAYDPQDPFAYSLAGAQNQQQLQHQHQQQQQQSQPQPQQQQQQHHQPRTISASSSSSTSLAAASDSFIAPPQGTSLLASGRSGSMPSLSTDSHADRPISSHGSLRAAGSPPTDQQQTSTTGPISPPTTTQPEQHETRQYDAVPGSTRVVTTASAASGPDDLAAAFNASMTLHHRAGEHDAWAHTSTSAQSTPGTALDQWGGPYQGDLPTRLSPSGASDSYASLNNGGATNATARYQTGSADAMLMSSGGNNGTYDTSAGADWGTSSVPTSSAPLQNDAFMGTAAAWTPKPAYSDLNTDNGAGNTGNSYDGSAYGRSASGLYATWPKRSFSGPTVPPSMGDRSRLASGSNLTHRQLDPMAAHDMRPMHRSHDQAPDLCVPTTPVTSASSHAAPRVCKYFQEGHCAWGDRCHYLHIVDSAATRGSGAGGAWHQQQNYGGNPRHSGGYGHHGNNNNNNNNNNSSSSSATLFQRLAANPVANNGAGAGPGSMSMHQLGGTMPQMDSGYGLYSAEGLAGAAPAHLDNYSTQSSQQHAQSMFAPGAGMPGNSGIMYNAILHHPQLGPVGILPMMAPSASAGHTGSTGAGGPRGYGGGMGGRRGSNSHQPWFMGGSSSLGMSPSLSSMSLSSTGSAHHRGHHGGSAGGMHSPSSLAESEGRFAGMALEDCIGQFLVLAKDQHGCRFMQRKLEEGGAAAGTRLLEELLPQFGELMMDPFGNYLCQKLLDYLSENQKMAILDNVAHDLVGIALNMHGTRAVQKLVDHVHTPGQIARLVQALSRHTVALVKDLNGNHVVQKCLVKLTPSDAQFIFDAVTRHCVEVATHRHGCCVLQRCLDYAAPEPRRRLAQEITTHCLHLVKDPFGNYVVQYVLDMGDPHLIEAVAMRLRGHVPALAMQKFASNVVEKCLRVAHVARDVRRPLIAELYASRDTLDRLLRDAYANYVVQTSIDYADPHQKATLIECLAPLVPLIRNTPYGKRIMAKLNWPPQMI